MGEGQEGAASRRREGLTGRGARCYEEEAEGAVSGNLPTKRKGNESALRVFFELRPWVWPWIGKPSVMYLCELRYRCMEYIAQFSSFSGVAAEAADLTDRQAAHRGHRTK